MNHPPRHNSAPTHTNQRVDQYPNAWVKVDKTPGARFDMSELTRKAADPLGDAMGGCVVIQTAYERNGEKVRERYYADMTGCADRERRLGVRVQPGTWEDPARTVTIGDQWQSPFGLTRGRVEAVVTPYVDALLEVGTTHHKLVSPTERGRFILDTLPRDAFTPVQLPEFGFVVNSAL